MNKFVKYLIFNKFKIITYEFADVISLIYILL